MNVDKWIAYALVFVLVGIPSIVVVGTMVFGVIGAVSDFVLNDLFPRKPKPAVNQYRYGTAAWVWRQAELEDWLMLPRQYRWILHPDHFDPRLVPPKFQWILDEGPVVSYKEQAEQR